MGIAPTLLREVVNELFAEMNEAEYAGKLLTKRFKGQDISDPKARTRAAAFLQRRGYSSKVIFDLLRYSIEED
jgi:SOS response regulatory protein OraA/RecX